MPTKSTAALFLERLQENVYRRIGRLDDLNYTGGKTTTLNYASEIIKITMADYGEYLAPEELSKIHLEMLRDLTENLENLEIPTQFEAPLYYSLMVDWQKEIEDAAIDLSLQIPTRPLVGTLPTGQANAVTILVPDSNEFLVLFESDLFNFALLSSKALVRALPVVKLPEGKFNISLKKAEVERRISENPESAQKFQEALLAYLLLGKAGKASPYVIEEPYRQLSSILRMSMELFIFGHEYGHIIKGHFSEEQRRAAMLGGEQVNVITRNWKQEIEADWIGLILMSQAMHKKGYDLEMSFWGADFFFSFVDFIERGISILRTGQEDQFPPGSHPPARLRRTALREALSVLAQGGSSMITNALEVATLVETASDALWNSTREVLQQEYERGRTLAAEWG